MNSKQHIANPSKQPRPFDSVYDAVLKTEFTVHGFIRVNYEEAVDQTAIFIPIEIKAIVLKFCGYIFIDSAILNETQKTMLSSKILGNRIYENDNDGIHLLFRASRDGFSEKQFHSVCDKKGATVVIAVTDRGQVFGGYTPNEWDSPSSGIAQKSDDIFIFTYGIANDCNIRRKQCSGIFNNIHYGPCFGCHMDHYGPCVGWHMCFTGDMFICADCNVNASSHAKGLGIGVKAQHKITIADYEVFCLQSKYIQMYMKHIEQLNAIIERRQNALKMKQLEYKPMPLPTGVNDADIFSLSDEEDEQGHGSLEQQIMGACH